MVNPAENHVGEKLLRLPGIIILSVYQILVVVAAFYILSCMWSGMSGAPAGGVPVQILSWSWTLPLEVLLLLIVACCGLLGSSLHCLRSLSWYVGSRALRRSWILRYLLQPFTGALLALIVYFVARAGFLPAAQSSVNSNYIGFAAIAGLVGLFSNAAVLKLKSVAENLFTQPKPGADHVSESSNPHASPPGDKKKETLLINVASGCRASARL
jgi:hypothetical protein